MREAVSAPMTDPTPAPNPPPATPPAGAPEPHAAARPDWLGENYWDGEKNAIKPEFGVHYADLATFHKSETDKAAALKARKPEDIKFEIKLPDTVKVPEGMQLKLDDKDPRLPVLRELALQQGLGQDTVNALVALDARMKIEAHNAETARVAAEDAKLGANGNDRKTAVSTWAKGLLDKKEISADEFDEIRMTATTAAGVTLLEKLIAKVNGSVPGTGNPPPPAPPPTRIEDRLYPKHARKVS
jgi:Phage T7 capsid assembly protein